MLCRSVSLSLCTLFIVTDTDVVLGQISSRPPRAVASQLNTVDSEGLFFEDLALLLKGDLPWTTTKGGTVPAESVSTLPVDDIPRWNAIISSVSLEDLIKDSKQRLDQAITTPSGFAGGGHLKARTEFSLLSLLFAIVENFPENARWKASSATMKVSMNTVASISKVGSRAVFDEAKRRKVDLEAVLNGEKVVREPNTDIGWEHLIDLGSMMQIIGLAYEKHITPGLASDGEFKKKTDELNRYSELIAVLSTIATFRDMPNAGDKEFCAIAAELASSAKLISEAVEKNDLTAARIASGQMGQSCQKCHDTYR